LFQYSGAGADDLASCVQFTQNEDMKEELFRTAGTMLVYADTYNTLLGIGLDMKSQDACKPDRWQGRNILGHVLTGVRNELLSKLQVMSVCLLIVLLCCKMLLVFNMV